jgi:hypothetical protein
MSGMRHWHPKIERAPPSNARLRPRAARSRAVADTSADPVAAGQEAAGAAEM